MLRTLTAALGAALLIACGNDDAADAMPEMTAEEHAMMLAGGTAQPGRQAVHLSAAQEAALGVTYLTVGASPLVRTVRVVGAILPAEPRVADVTPKIEGFVERLYVDATGTTVARGAPLLEIYSPSLVAAQEEYLTARRLVAGLDSSAGEAWRAAVGTMDASRRRLAYWDITEEQIDRLAASGTVSRTLTLVSPVRGVVLDKQVLEGQRVMPGERLYRIADLSAVWVEGDVFEQDLALVREGAQAHIEVSAYPGEHLMGRISFIYPTVDVRTRTNRIRLTVANRDGRLKPGMFATIWLEAEVGRGALIIPRQAVIVTGERNVVFVRDADGMLQPREVVLGARAGDRVAVLSGLAAGERIVASANFLVDAESRLGSTGSGMPGMQHGAVEPVAADTASPAMQEHNHD